MVRAMSETRPEVWSTDAGLRVEASAHRLALFGVARGEDTCVGLRLGGLSVELGLRPGLQAKEAVRLLLSALPEESRAHVVLEADAQAPAAVALAAEAEGKVEVPLAVAPASRHAVDAPV